jgi:hypothetical protein
MALIIPCPLKCIEMKLNTEIFNIESKTLKVKTTSVNFFLVYWQHFKY